MQTQTKTPAISRTNLVYSLEHLCQEWQTATNGQSLLEVKGSVGLILADLAMSIGLTTLEQIQVFGADMTHELDTVLSAEPEGNGSK